MENKKHFLFDLKIFSDEDGSLIVVEENKQIPFEIKRIFYEFNVSSSSIRGKHANMKSKFCLVCVAGSCEIVVDDGHEIITYNLDKPNKVLFINKMVWKTMNNFSSNCVLLVISDSFYDGNEYIRDYENYLKLVSEDEIYN